MIKYYPDKTTILNRFRLLPQQECDNEWFVRYISEHSVRKTSEGWRWKFDDSMFNSLKDCLDINSLLDVLPYLFMGQIAC